MFKKGILFILVLAVSTCFIFSGCSKDKGTGKKLTIATDATWPPMEFVNKDKEIVGFNIDMMKAIAQEAGFEVEFQNTAWDGIFAGLAANKYDAVISSVTITEERQKNMDFSAPYVNAGQVIVVKKELEGLDKLAQFEGKSAGAQIGTTGAFEIAKHKGVTLRSYDEIGLAIEDLANGRVDAVVCDSPIAADYVLQNEQYKKVLKIVGEPFTKEEYGIAVNKGNKEILDLINGGLAKVLKKGTNKELEKKWLK